ncbi:unnamed protein product [Caenorhabditis angaria]|uniref:Uncharacterized protein n=1 Tax=Caenorhabditis angaria TaxID=860376 RepID=A0A9P1I4F0_9PELO|nr:unnamed protein product [Caenorhabditis angaria]
MARERPSRFKSGFNRQDDEDAGEIEKAQDYRESGSGQKESEVLFPWMDEAFQKMIIHQSVKKLRSRSDRNCEEGNNETDEDELDSATLFSRYWEQNLEKNNEYLQMVFGPQCPLLTKVSTKNKAPQNIITKDDVYTLYVRSVEARQYGRYREAFQLLRPTMPFLATNHLVWIRITEMCIFELFEETWDFLDIYTRLFQDRPKNYYPSHRRQMNEIRQRHNDMNLRFAYIASNVAYTLCKLSESHSDCFSATQNHAFLMLKMRKYREALDAISYFLKKTEECQAATDQIEHMLLYKAEAKYYLGKYDRAIEYSLKVQKDAQNCRLKMRAEMLLAMAYLKKNNYKLSYQYVMGLVSCYRLDDFMVENVALFGVTLAHKMKNYPMLQTFLKLLQDCVH